MISVMLLALAFFMIAVMDTVKDHWASSVFSEFDHEWWDGQESWKNQYFDRDSTKEKTFEGKYLPFFFDAWHSAKTIMLVCIFLAVVSYHPMVNWLVDLLIVAGTYALVFNLFYGKLLVKPSSN
jgi:hypothetical protein